MKERKCEESITEKHQHPQFLMCPLDRYDSFIYYDIDSIIKNKKTD
ncbi:MAG: hypothetical protein Q4Q22_08910 [Methanosphaera sp.]|nr:hypothetical protein [Methanosphaera sp.]